MTDSRDGPATNTGKVGTWPRQAHEIGALLDDAIGEFVEAQALVSVACKAIEKSNDNEEGRWAAVLVLRKGLDALDKVAAKLAQMQISNWIAHQGSECREIACPGSPTR